MKKLLISIVLLAMLLSACSANTAATAESAEPTVDLAATTVAEVLSATQTAMAAEQQAAASSATTATLTTDFTDAAPIYMQLMLGIMKLESTEQVITADQANAILALVTTLQSDTTTQTGENTDQSQGPGGRGMGLVVTQEQIDTLVGQVTAILNNDQIAAIAAMQITQESTRTILEELGLTDSPQQEGTPMAADGEMPQGGAPGDGQGGPGGGGPGGGGGAPGDGQMGTAPDSMGTPSADMQTDGVMIQPQMIQALLTYLQGKTAS